MKLLTSAQYAEVVGIKPQSARLQRMRGGGPPFIRMTNCPTGRVFYRAEEVERWIAERPSFRSTGEEKALLHAARKASGGVA